MSLFAKIIKYITNPKYRTIVNIDKGLYKYMPDEKYIALKFESRLGVKPNLTEPRTFNEKLQWLKLHDRKPLYTTLVDKYAVKRYVASIIGEEYIIPTIGIYNNFNNIDFKKLPKQFVIKCTHDSGGLVICKDKNKLNIKEARKKINKCLKRNFYYIGREWPYKNVKPRIIIEKYMEDKSCSSTRDYKFFCFNGKPTVAYISDGSHTDDQKIAFFDMSYRQLDIKRSDYGDYDIIPRKPKNWEKMKELSSKLSYGMPHIRVDWYEIDGKLYFGELTFFTCSGIIPFEKESWNLKLGNMIDLTLVKLDEK